MKKRKVGRSLSRSKSQRAALKKALLVGLVENRSVKTTQAKAKELTPFAERAITKAKKASQDKIASIRELKKIVPEKTAHQLIEIAKLFKDRKGGYTRIIKLPNRASDSAEMAMIQWVEPANELKVESKKLKEDKGKDKKKNKKETTDNKKK